MSSLSPPSPVVAQCHQPVPTNDNTNQANNNLKVLIFYMTFVIVICLTAFNFYLFCWIIASLSGNNSSTANANEHSATAASLTKATATATNSIDFFTFWDKVRFEGRVATKRALQVDQISAPVSAGKPLSLISKNLVQVSSVKSNIKRSQNDHLKTNQNNQTINLLLELSAKEQRIRFPNGLIVRSIGHSNHLSTEAAALVCSPGVAPHCELRAARSVTLNAPGGVDFERKSVQSPQVETSRLHSPTKALQMLSTSGSELESRTGKMELRALDDVLLTSRNSTVILNAKRIDISLIQSATTNSVATDKSYKLCVCLPTTNKESSSARSEQRKVDKSNSTASKKGLVFAVSAMLNCAQFTQFCLSSKGDVLSS